MDRADPVPKEEEATTAMDVYATLCAQVMTKSTTASAWAKFSAVLLDPETEAFFKARVQEGDVDPPSKKQKQIDGGRNPPTVCAHCGGNVPEIALRVACVDGTTLDVCVAQCGVVRDIKDTVGQVCVRGRAYVVRSQAPYYSIACIQIRGEDPNVLELFLKGNEDPLLDATRLDSTGVGHGAVLFLLQRPGKVACHPSSTH